MTHNKTRRQRPESDFVTISTVDEANDALREIAIRKIELARIDADAQESIDIIKEGAVKSAKSYKSEILQLEKGIVAFAKTGKNELFRKKKSVECTFGSFGFRKSTSIYIRSHQVTVGKLKGFGRNEAITVKEVANKEVLGTFSDEELAEVNAQRKVKDDFWYEINEERIAQKPK